MVFACVQDLISHSIVEEVLESVAREMDGTLQSVVEALVSSETSGQ